MTDVDAFIDALIDFTTMCAQHKIEIKGVALKNHADVRAVYEHARQRTVSTQLYSTHPLKVYGVEIKHD